MKHIRFVAGLAAAAAAVMTVSLALAGCAPAYIEALDRAAQLTRQMTVVGILPAIGLSSTESNPRLLPQKPTASSISGLNIQSGFLVTDGVGEQNVRYAFVDSSGQTQTASSLSPFSMAGADPNFPLYQYEVAATTTTANLVVFYMNPTTPASSTATLVTATLPSGPLGLAGGPVTLTPTVVGAGACLIGEQVVPTAFGGPDTFNWLYTNNPGTGQYAYLPSPTLSGLASVFNAVAPALVPIAPIPALSRAMHYHNGSKSYVQYRQGNQWVAYEVSGTPVLLTGITRRIDALLTTGDLLSTEGDTLTLYDPSGNQLKSIPMGGLQFCYEAYLGSNPYVFFSLPILVKHDQWSFVVYAIPTSSMPNL